MEVRAALASVILCVHKWRGVDLTDVNEEGDVKWGRAPMYKNDIDWREMENSGTFDQQIL